ncbi:MULTISPECIES: NUDIX hydrolase [unclassified Streptomyces]|uniref:NUDIX hydrolase n=1 Tax=unclassified Streptomyces TaxID=2593676 RepID=UPI002E21483B
MINLPITADHIRATLTAYRSEYPGSEPELDAVVGLLDDGDDLTSRTTSPGHATAGAILVGPDDRVLHIRHVATGKWLLPGGHLERADNSLLQAAARELFEETGIPSQVITPQGEGPLHIDLHSIDANPAKDEPAHQHFDFRFLFRTTADIGELQTEEVSDAVWRNVDEITNPRLRLRIATALQSDSDGAMSCRAGLADHWPGTGD